jgi:hypothetical protein
LGYQDIDFESHSRFSSSYLLRGPNEAAIRAEFSPNILDYFENQPAHWHVETQLNRMAVFRRGRVKPDDLHQFLGDATRIYLLFEGRTSIPSDAADTAS